MCAWDPYHQKTSGGLWTCLGLGGHTGRNHVFKQKPLFSIAHRRSHAASNLLFQHRFYSILLFFLDALSGRVPWTPTLAHPSCDTTHATDAQLQGHTRTGTCARALIRLLTCNLPYCCTLHAWEATSCTPPCAPERPSLLWCQPSPHQCPSMQPRAQGPPLAECPVNVRVPTAPPEVFHPHRAHRRQRLTHVRYPLLV